ncbi:MAG: hypothetical protein KKB37_13185 [Alphaproteobacteria bacterium]|nr:hypothetical protein [Alphaproteobacteria bacterium]
MFFLFASPAIAHSPALRRLGAGLNQVRADYPSMTVGTLATLIECARLGAEMNEAPSLALLGERLGIPYPSLTRQTDFLGDGIGKSPGLRLIEKRLAPDSRKNKIVEITPAGSILLAQLHNSLSSPVEIAADITNSTD